MKLIAMCVILAALVGIQITVADAAVPAASAGHHAAQVGLYAPDRYDGIPDMCLMPMDFGYCRAKVKRYYFDMRRMKCVVFYFGGCAGNINNFKSLEECNKTCLDDSTGGTYDDDLSSNNVNTRNSYNSNKNLNNNNNKSNVNSNYKTDNRRIGSGAKTNYNTNNNSNNNNKNNNDDNFQEEEENDYSNN